MVFLFTIQCLDFLSQFENSIDKIYNIRNSLDYLKFDSKYHKIQDKILFKIERTVLYAIYTYVKNLC